MKIKPLSNICFILTMITFSAQQSSSLSSVDPKSKGMQVLKQRKAEARVNRITTLLSEEKTLTLASRKELASLLNSDTYDPSSFSESHRQFKVDHNNVFATLGLYCSECNEKKNTRTTNKTQERPVFYLDGFQGETTKNLRLAGFQDCDLFSANIFENTASALKIVHSVNTHHGRAHDSLTTVFSTIAFCSYYLDGCSGSSQSVIDIIEAIFTDNRLAPLSSTSLPAQDPETVSAAINTKNNEYETTPKSISTTGISSNTENEIAKYTENIKNSLNSFSIGFTLTNAGGKDIRSLVDREQEVTKCINKMSRRYGYSMTYVGDDPELYGLESSPLKREGDVQTTWVVVSTCRL